MIVTVRKSLLATLLSLLLALAVLAQTATTTSISGLVADPQGAIVAGATVSLKDKATNQERTAITNDEGKYIFSNLGAGVYDLTISAQGFKKAVITDLKADVTKAVTQDVRLEAGGLTEEVTIAAGTEAQLQKQDAALGNTFENKRVALLPNISRDATPLLSLQPGTTPTGEITGARADQSTFSLDGIDVSDNVIGQTFRTVIPTPTEAVEEFRVTVANPNATFGRSSGAQVTFVTKRGTNQFHGSAYEYLQNDKLNANSWTSNRLGLSRPVLRDNRFGGSVGGPIFKDKTFFFLLYEGRRNSGATTVMRIVPTSTLKQGLLRFNEVISKNPDGTPKEIVTRTINPRSFDPRNLGANPLILSMLALYPDANDFTVGDGLNTASFTANLPTNLRGDQSILRLDHAFNDKWKFDGAFNAFRQLQIGIGQVDIVNRKGTASTPSRPRSLSAGLTGILTQHLTNEFRFGWVHDRLAFDRISPVPQVSGLNIAIDLAGTLLDEPVDVDTQRARKQARTVNVYQFIDNLNWLKDTHTIQAGFNVRHITSFDFRDDKVIGSISTPVGQIGSLAFNALPSSQRPDFIQTADLGRYNQLYAALLGQVENVTYLATRDGQLQPNPIGTGLVANSKLNAYEMYAADTWRVKPSLTFSYGLMYTWQVPPTEAGGKQTVVVRQDTGELVNSKTYLQQKLAAAQIGLIFNPTLAYLPIKESGRKYAFNTDRKNFSPRLAVAWTPSYRGGLLGALLGDNKTVIRGGYSLLYDRINTVQTIIIPTLGVGFAQTLETRTTLNGSGQPFRVGIDGALPVPVPTAAKSPIVPGVGGVPSEVLSFVVNPFIKVPRNHTIDFTIQRELPGGMIFEVGYVGRLARDLYQSVNLNQVPYQFKDTRSGQTFAQAFDALANELRNGVSSAAVTPQPWFENLLVNLAPLSGSRTRAFAARQTANLINGNLSNLFLGSNGVNARSGLSFVNPQATELFFRDSNGRSNYHALTTTVRKRFSNGLSFDANYTFSRSLDQLGAVQNSAGLAPNSFDLDSEYGFSPFDITHIFNSNFVYELPFGQGRRYANFSNGILSRLVSGWYTAGIYRAATGSPLTIVQGSQVWGGSALLGNNSGAIGLGGADFSPAVRNGVKGSGGIGTAGDPANRGSGINIFSDPQKVYSSVRRVLLSQDTRSGRSALRGLGYWQYDMTLGKTTRITEKVTFRFSADFINLFNHVNFADPATSLQGPTTFGVINSQAINDLANIFPRRIQFGARIEF
ncbi:MAG: carboxypeptidase regulatory-like domain-containing protein [Acidobacteria bacterium]|nr:carboxypeptidase regulatory-like domain-containing protein [Acidobacteriota bacterium]